MTRRVGVYEAKTKLPELIEAVAHGAAPIVITRYGVPVAMLSAVDAAAGGLDRREAARRAATEWDAESAGIRLGDDLSIRDLIQMGRR